ncbi:MAG: ABC transporter permease subunit [Spirochaetales bacterium]
MSPRIRVRRWGADTWALGATLTVLLSVTVAGFFVLSLRGLDLGAAFAKVGHDLGILFLTPGAEHFTLPEMLQGLGFTLALGLLTTVLGALPALVLGLFAARNLGPAWLGWVLRAFVAFVRAVPTVLWVLIFAIGAGLGSVAAVVGMTFHSFGYLLKAFSESFEELDDGTLEALKASGADWLAIVTQAVLPSSLAALTSWTFLRFEINFVTAVAMGAAAGAGGVGFDLFMASGFYFNLHEVGMLTWGILATAVALEWGATRLRDSAGVRS